MVEARTSARPLGGTADAVDLKASPDEENVAIPRDFPRSADGSTGEEAGHAGSPPRSASAADPELVELERLAFEADRAGRKVIADLYARKIEERRTALAATNVYRLPLPKSG